MKNKYLVDSVVDKITAILVLICMTTVAVGCILAVKTMYEFNIYSDGGEYAWQYYRQLKTQSNMAEAEEYFTLYSEKENTVSQTRLATYSETFSQQNSNFFFSVKDTAGTVLFKNYDGPAAQYKSTKNFTCVDDEGNIVAGTINGYVRSDLEAEDGYSAAFSWIKLAHTLRFAVFAVLIIALILVVFLITLLACSGANNRDKNGRIIPGFIDKLPLDITFIASISMIVVCWLTLGLTELADVNMVLYHVVVIIVACIGVIIVQTFATTLCTRIMMGKLWRNTMIYRGVVFVRRRLPKNMRKKNESGISYFTKLVIIIGVVNFIGLVIIAFFAYQELIRHNIIFDYYILFWVIERLILIPVVIMLALNFQYIKDEGQRLASGDFGEETASHITIKGFRAHSENLDHIRRDIVKAFEQEVKSEKMKNELIANVSHDIKTPLTSIVSYIDLLRSKNLSPEQMEEYLDVLERQSGKLKTLLDSLIEASKASSGDFAVNLEPTNLAVLLEQTIGEFEETLHENNLEFVAEQIDDSLNIMADGNLLWRIFSNLLNNICKYALSGTKVRLGVKKQNENAIITFRNISKCAVGGSEELMERFVRGDGSRHEDGNGLGLSIAKNLAELQGGKMELVVDGDLFKVILTFNLAQ